MYTWDAVDDLDSIFDYISDDNQVAAIKMLAKLESAILGLGGNPRMGTVVSLNMPAMPSSNYRKIIVAPYVVFYRIGEHEIYILRVLHSRQDWMHLLFDQIF